MYTWKFTESNPLNFTFFNDTYPILYTGYYIDVQVLWAGYEFYVSQPNYINSVFATINMPNTYVPWGQVDLWDGIQLGLASCVGLSPAAGGDALNGTPYLAQTGYIIAYYWLMPVGSAQLFNEVLPKPVQYYPGSPEIVMKIL